MPLPCYGLGLVERSNFIGQRGAGPCVWDASSPAMRFDSICDHYTSRKDHLETSKVQTGESHKGVGKRAILTASVWFSTLIRSVRRYHFLDQSLKPTNSIAYNLYERSIKIEENAVCHARRLMMVPVHCQYL